MINILQMKLILKVNMKKANIQLQNQKAKKMSNQNRIIFLKKYQINHKKTKVIKSKRKKLIQNKK